MGRKRRYTPLNVFLNARHIGVLSRESSGAVKFSYDNTWIEWEHAIPVSLSLPVRHDAYTGAEVLAVFDNLLPDYDPIRRIVAERVGASGTDAFSLLSEIGRDCVGALQFLPDGEVPQSTQTLTGEALSNDAIATLLKGLDVTPLGIRGDSEFRISVAGAQQKTALLYNNKQWIQPSGTTPTTHIIKPPIGQLNNGIDLSNSVENEYLCLTLLKNFALPVANVNMVDFAGCKALAIERFDRKWTADHRLIRLPQEDCCQALSVVPTQKYQSEGGPGIESIMRLLQGSDEPTDDRTAFFKANILFWLMAATDGHAKNFSLALYSRGRFNMTPLYDVISLQPVFDSKKLQHKDFKMAMRVGQSKQYNVEHIVGRHFIDTGLQSGLSRKAIAMLFDDIISTTHAALDTTASQLPNGFPQPLFESLSNGIKHRLTRLNT